MQASKQQHPPAPAEAAAAAAAAGMVQSANPPNGCRAICATYTNAAAGRRDSQGAIGSSRREPVVTWRRPQQAPVRLTL
jgi:hypothetical protein